MGRTADLTMAGGARLRAALLPNPSHLEVVNPLVLGKARAKQDIAVKNTMLLAEDTAARRKVMPVLLHGDGARRARACVHAWCQRSCRGHSRSPRRRVHGQRRRHGGAAAEGAARVQHARDGAHRHEQPARLHDRRARGPLHPLLHCACGRRRRRGRRVHGCLTQMSSRSRRRA